MYGANYFGQPFYAQSYPNGIQFDATAGSGYHAADGTYTWTHVVGTGSNQILVVSVALLSVTNSVTALTYNSVALTKLRSDVSASTTVRTEIWYLVAPATGSHSVSITLNAANVSAATSTSYNNVDQATPADAQSGGTDITGAGGGSSSISTTPVTNGAWLVDAIATADTAITPTNLQTARGNITGAVGSGGQSDKQPNVIGGSAVTMGWDNIAALTTWTMSTMALRPSTGANLFISTLIATLSFIGSLPRFTTYPLAATVSFVGSLAKTGKKTLAGALSFTGAFVKTDIKVLGGTLSFTGTIAKFTTYVLTGTLSFVGSLIKRTSRALTGTLSFVGSLTKMAKKTLSGLVSFTTTFVNNTSAIFTAALTLSGNLNKRTSRSLIATLSFSGTLLKLTIKLGFSGGLSFIGNFSKMPIKVMSATVSFVGSISYWASRVYRTVVKSTNKPETVKTGDKVEEIKSSATLEEVSTGTKNETVSTGQTDTTVTTSRKDTTT